MAALNKESRTVIREVRVADAPALTRLAGELGYPATEIQFQRRFEHVTMDRAQQIFVAESPDGAVVAWVHVQLGRWLVVDPRGEVMGLIVTAPERGRGIGRQLMQAAESWTRQQGGTLLTLRSNIVRKEAHVFYQRMGYAVTKTSLNFSKTL
ncbi:MAG: GNAT family N-acetyltransferase [Opitutaceae bacterium]